jgi:DinB superfamily
MILELVGSFDRSLAYMRGLIADLSDEEMLLQPPGGPNHAAWTLGHVILSCQAIAGELGVPPWLPGDWETRFGYGSAPAGAADAEGRGKAALLSSLADASNRLRAALLATDEDRLKDPLPDEKTREILPTLGDALLQTVCAHTAFHAGQLAAWRRAIGRPPVGVFV